MLNLLVWVLGSFQQDTSYYTYEKSYHWSLYDITQGLIAIGSVFKNQSNNHNIFICGLVPCNESVLINRLIINEVNDLLKSKCLVKSFHFTNQNNGWTLDNNGTLGFSLFYSDALHLVEKGNFKLDKSILKAIDSNSNMILKYSMLQFKRMWLPTIAISSNQM